MLKLRGHNIKYKKTNNLLLYNLILNSDVKYSPKILGILKILQHILLGKLAAVS